MSHGYCKNQNCCVPLSFTEHVFNLCIEDILPPTFENCPDTSIVIQAEKGTTTALVTWPDIVAKDNSGYSNVQQSKGLAPGSRFTQGVTEVRYTAVDGSGNTAQPCSFTIIVEGLAFNY